MRIRHIDQNMQPGLRKIQIGNGIQLRLERKSGYDCMFKFSFFVFDFEKAKNIF